MLKKIICILSMALLVGSFIGCETAIEKELEQEYEAQQNAKRYTGDPDLLFLAECPNCGSEFTCTDEYCMDIPEEKAAYEKHQEEYQQQKEIERLKDTCAYCGYVEVKAKRKDFVKPYPYGENGETVYLCDEKEFRCAAKYKDETGYNDPRCYYCKQKGKTEDMHRGDFADDDAYGDDDGSEYLHGECFGKFFNEE